MPKKNNKEKIFKVSIDLFSKYGYDRVSIRQIAKEVGIKESSIYNHYESKESILESILNYYINEMLKEEAPITQSSKKLDLGLEYFYKLSCETFISKLSEEKLLKITRIFLVESYHNQKIKNFLKESIINYAIQGWIEIFNLMKEKKLIKTDSNTKQLAESFYYYGLFLLYEHFIINYPEDDEKFIKEFKIRTTNHMNLLLNSVKITNENNEIIRLEEEKDHLKVENLVRNAFWNIYRPGAYEHYIVHKLRKDSNFIADLAYIIEKDNEIIGHINYSKGKLNLKNKKTELMEEAIVLGPIAINPKYQKQGYGSKLINYTLNVAKSKGIPHIFVIGDENYYNKFGFKTASKYNLFLEGTNANEENPFFMIKIFKNTFKDKNYTKGIFSNPNVFNVNEDEVDEFDKNFEYKEKKILKGQLE